MKIYFILCFCALFTSLNAQSNNCQLTFSSGDTLSNIALLKVGGDSLNIIRDSTSQWIKVAPINEVRFVKESKVWETSERYAYYIGITGGCAGAVSTAITAKGSSPWRLQCDCKGLWRCTSSTRLWSVLWTYRWYNRSHSWHFKRWW